MTALAALRTLPRSTVVLRSLILVLPPAALLVALPTRPDTWLVTLVVLGSARWAGKPEDVAGAIVLVLVIGWWGINGADGPRLLVVAAFLLGAHVAAIVSGYGPAALAVARGVLRLWAGRAALAAVPVPIAYLALQRLEAGAAPPWLWVLSVATVLLLTLTASVATRVEER